MDEPRKRPGMAVLIYLVPALVDLLLSLVIFVGTVRAARLKGDATHVGAVLAVWSILYILTCPLLGRWVTPRNAHGFVLAGCLTFAVACALLATAASFLPMILLVGVTGMASALFFVAFQILMKEFGAAGGRPLTYSVGIYIFAWSAGFAFGPMVSGFLMQSSTPAPGGGEGAGWRYAFLLAAGIAFAISAALAMLFHPRNRRRTEMRDAPAPPAETTCYDALPDLSWLGWIVAATGIMALSINRTVFASRAVNALHLLDGTIGTIFFVLFLSQSITGLALTRSRFWMYRPLLAAAFALSGILGLLCFGFGQHLAIFLAGAALFGIYSGSFFFYMVFHALVHPEHAGRYIAVNETIVGIASFAGPLLGGILADACGMRFAFLAAAGLTVLATAFQCRITAKSGRCLP